MRIRNALSLLALAAAFAGAAAGARASPWSAETAPSAGPARAIGASNNGCLAGAATLPPDGQGYQAIRLSRRRNYGLPETVAFVERLGRRDQAAGLAPFYVGDMAQPRGGPTLSGHVSHQTGVDVDIWFNLDRKPVLAPAARESVPLPSMVLPDQSAIDPARFGARQVTLLRLAAEDPAVDRIFVHWTIKRALCRGIGGAATGDRNWLHRIRPWYGHDDEFHVRLRCPAGSPDCVAQAPVPPGDGCDASLDWWFARREHPATPAPAPRPSVPRPAKVLPAQCRAVLAAP